MTPDSFGDPRLSEILRYWLSKRRDSRPPRRADIKPAEMGASLLRHLNIVEVVREPGKPLQFRHRLIGTYNIEWLGRDSTGQMLDEELYGEAAPAIIASFARIVSEARPFYRLTRMDWQGKQHLVSESIELPLSDETNAVAMILRGAIFRHAKDGKVPDALFEPVEI